MLNKVLALGLIAIWIANGAVACTNWSNWSAASGITYYTCETVYLDGNPINMKFKHTIACTSGNCIETKCCLDTGSDDVEWRSDTGTGYTTTSESVGSC